MDRPAAALALLCGLAVTSGAAAADDLWSVSLYGGPTTDTITTQIASGHLHIIGGMAGLSVNRRLSDLGSGFSLMLEGQVTQYFTHDSYETVALGVGVRFDRFPWSTPTTLAIHFGPSYAFDPPPVGGSRHPWLNYVSAEYAMQIPHTQNLDWVLRLYHRSGAWGLYARNVDQGTMVGVGLRLRM